MKMTGSQQVPGLSSVDQASGNLLSSSRSDRALHISLQTPSQFAQKTKQLGEMLIYMVVVLASGDRGWIPLAVNVPSLLGGT